MPAPSILRFVPPRAGLYGSAMRGFFSNPRRALIVIHDLVMTAAAMLAAFYFRFEDIGLAQRFHWLLIVLPGYLVYAGVVYWIFKLYAAKWRFASLPDLWNIFRAVTVLALSLLVLDYVLVAPNFYGTFFFGKITIVLYWVLQMFFLGGPRIAYRLFRHARTQHTSADPTRSRRSSPGAPPTPKFCCARSRAARSRRSGRSAFCRRRAPTRARRMRGVPVLRRSRRSRTRRRATLPEQRHDVARLVLTPSRAGAGSASGSDPDAGAPARACDQPAAGARRRRRGVAAGAGRRRGSAAAAEREDRLSAAGSSSSAAKPSWSPAAAARSARRSATAWSRSARRGCW